MNAVVAAASGDTARALVEIGAVAIGLALLARLASRWGAAGAILVIAVRWGPLLSRALVRGSD